MRIKQIKNINISGIQEKQKQNIYQSRKRIFFLIKIPKIEKTKNKKNPKRGKSANVRRTVHFVSNKMEKSSQNHLTEHILFYYVLNSKYTKNNCLCVCVCV